MELTTAEAAQQLHVNQSRVRALVSSGTLLARRVGNRWLIDADSVDRQASLTAAHANGRAMAHRIAWAAADLADKGDAGWLNASERSRLRRRLRGLDRIEVAQKWLGSRMIRVARYQVGERDLADVLRDEGVVSTGVSAAPAYGLGLGAGGTADAYVTRRCADALIRKFFLIESRSGNLTLRTVETDLHLLTARPLQTLSVAPRLITGVDLADDPDTRTRSSGRKLLNTVLNEQHSGG